MDTQQPVEMLHEFELILSAGDIYEMDGPMQQHYWHGIPKDRSQTGSAKYARIALVFRDGHECFYAKDNGKPLDFNLAPRNCDIVYKVRFILAS